MHDVNTPSSYQPTSSPSCCHRFSPPFLLLHGQADTACDGLAARKVRVGPGAHYIVRSVGDIDADTGQLPGGLGC